MTSKSEQILDRIEIALAATDGATGIYRDRWEALSRAEMPAIAVYPEDESDDVVATCGVTSELRVRVDILIDGAPLSTLADPLRVSAHALLTAEPFTGLGVIHCYPDGRRWDAESGEIGVLSCRYRVAYRTTLASIE
jgi:hypothetical protein